MLKFYCYNFTAEKNTEQIIAEIRELCERTKQYEREEEIMLFVYVPTVSLEAVCRAIPERKLVKISCQEFCIEPVTDGLTPDKLKAIGADMAITGLADHRYLLHETNERCREKLKVILELGFKAMLCVGETREMAVSGAAKEVLAEQIRVGYAKIPYEAHYRIGTIYRPLWEFDHSYEADESYTLKMFEVMKAAVKEALPGFPIEMPFFYGGRLSAEKLQDYFDHGLIDGVFWDSRDYSIKEFADIIDFIS